VGAIAVGLASCSSNPVDSMTFYPVKGKVLLPDGKPLSSGNVVFVATKTSLTSTADIEKDGSFTVKGSKDGLPPGDYKVRIEVEGSEAGSGKGKPVRLKGGSAPFPGKYLDEDTSGLTATVKPGDSNSFEFNLKK
jgi:hypothetical protein